ncbi:MAG: ACT domain-containing protein, partial [Actinomycetes bacterium]
MSPTQDSKTTFTGLILLSGIDKPGVTEGLFAALSPFAVTIQDLEQVVIRGRLILTALITLDPAHVSSIEADITAFAEGVDLDFAIDYVDLSLSNSSEKRSSLHVVLLSAKLLPTALSAVAGEIALAGGNIDRIRRTASFPLTAIEFDISVPVSGEIDSVLSSLRRALAQVAIENSVDLAVEMGGLTRRA